MEFIEELLGFGLTRQEATIYYTILVSGEMTGYEAAKLTGISRSNTYLALAGLVDKGAAYIIEGTGTKYMPVDVKDFANNKIRNLEELKESLLEHRPVPEVTGKGYITIKGEKHIINQYRNMILKAEKRIYLLATGKITDILVEYEKFFYENDIKVVVITDKKNYRCSNANVYYTDSTIKQIGMIIDSVEVLTGELGEGKNATCLYTKNNTFIEVFKEMIANKIKLIQIQGGNV